MNPEEMLKKLEPNLPGLLVRGFKLVEGGLLILYLGHVPRPTPEKETRFWIDDASWRMLDGTRFIAGSLDDPKFLLPKLRELIGTVVKSVKLNHMPQDVELGFDNGIRIESFTRNIDGDQWELRRADGLRLGLGKNMELYEEFEEPDRERSDEEYQTEASGDNQ